MWQLLLTTLPTRPNAVRVRIWRSLRSVGSPALRDGAYLLPVERAALFDPIVDDIRTHGGTAHVLRLAPTSDTQRDEVLALFDRTEAFAAWGEDAAALRKELARITESEARRRMRLTATALEELHRIDYLPGAAAQQASAMLDDLREALEARFSPGEPRAAKRHGIPLLDRAAFRGKVWATRSRPWVDRLASAWLIGRFVDPAARFVWVDDLGRLPRGVIGYDFDGARFTHVGARVTFEVLAASFGLDADPRLARIGAAVRMLDVGGLPMPEAAGLEAVLAGLREQHADDAALQAAAVTVFDALHAAPLPLSLPVAAAAPPTRPSRGAAAGTVIPRSTRSSKRPR
jgi:hypothetical protein